MIPVSQPLPSRARRAGAAILIALTGLLAEAAGSAGAEGGGASIGGPTSSLPGSSAAAGGPSGGAGLGGLAPTSKPPAKIPAPPSRHDHGKWLGRVTITEYWPAPESWFRGALVSTPGLTSQHRIDWLYSAMGLSMEGQGIGLDGRMYHIDALGNGGWVTIDGVGTDASNGWSAGAPYWRAGGYWRNRSGGVTFPLQAGGWSAGAGRKYLTLPGVSFASGGAQTLHFYRSIAVDPGVIPLGSRVYIPAYKHDGYGGWFVAQDTGGAIAGDHVDVYRSPPASSTTGGQYLTAQRIYVIRPGGR